MYILFKIKIIKYFSQVIKMLINTCNPTIVDVHKIKNPELLLRIISLFSLFALVVFIWLIVRIALF